VPEARDYCPHCGARQERGAPNQEDAWSSGPVGFAQIGYLLLIATGGLIALAAMAYGLWALFREGEVIDRAVSLALTVTGLSLLLGSVRAFSPRRWRLLTLAPEWMWLGLLFLIWFIGILAGSLLPGTGPWVYPVLIVAGAGLASLLFLRATLHGLQAPAGRDPLSGKFLPRHVVLLSASLSASVSSLLSLIVEGVVLAGAVIVMLVTALLLGDQPTVELIERAARDPQALQSLETAIASSPLAVASLACLAVFVVPIIEETFKGLPLLLFARSGAQVTERMAILLGVAGGVGFAFIENVGYLGTLADNWGLVLWFRAAAAMMHGAASGFTGRAWYRGPVRGEWTKMALDLVRSWGIHGFWNALALLVGWFAYREVMEGVLFCVAVGLVPLAILFTVMARWGIWVSKE
jgi:RsiW-degrading membrane proteinase PrsW (M82 family)